MIKLKLRSIDITPCFPSRLTGMKYNERHEDIHSNLEANVLLFDNNNKKIFIFSIDTLFINKEIKSIVRDEVIKNFGIIEETDLLIISTHTHFSPSLEEFRSEIGIKDEEYFIFFKQKIAELIYLLSISDYFDFYIEEVIGKTNNLTSNRRRRVRTIKNYFKSFVTMEPDNSGFKNEEFKIVKLYDKINNSLLGVIWSFPCHPTNNFNKKRISAEFPGLIRDFIRKQVDNTSVSVVYFPGFAGDVRSIPPKRKNFMRAIRNFFQLSYPVNYYRFINQHEYNDWINSLKSCFWDIWSKSIRINSISSDLESQYIEHPINVLGIHVKNTEHIIFRKVMIGKVINIYTISAEVSSEYIKNFENLEENKVFYIASGYADEVYGYLPTQKQIKEGGYESKDHLIPFLISGEYNHLTQNIVESWIKLIQ
ncbi:MAG TPA: hypothetical protein PKN32_04565 [Bacteroidales bacterium]|nr:hypothetical protein [Bacteroidales bacterium]